MTTNDQFSSVGQTLGRELKRYKLAGVIVGLAGIALSLFVNILKSMGADQSGIVSLGETPSVNLKRSSEIAYDLNLATERFLLYVPPNYTGRERFGLIVYTSPADSIGGLPFGWADVLAKHKLLFLAPQNAGNDCQHQRRQGLNVLGALAMERKYNIDSSKIYAAGLSGGARTAGHLGFFQPDLFSGTIQSCGSDFYHQVPHTTTADKWIDTNGNPYGVINVPDDNVREARAKVRFVLITGSGDFRHGNVSDLYNNGYKREGFKAKLIDVPGMGHQDCSGQTLDEALNFIAGTGT